MSSLDRMAAPRPRSGFGAEPSEACHGPQGALRPAVADGISRLIFLIFFDVAGDSLRPGGPGAAMAFASLWNKPRACVEEPPGAPSGIFGGVDFWGRKSHIPCANIEYLERAWRLI